MSGLRLEALRGRKGGSPSAVRSTAGAVLAGFGESGLHSMNKPDLQASQATHGTALLGDSHSKPQGLGDSHVRGSHARAAEADTSRIEKGKDDRFDNRGIYARFGGFIDPNVITARKKGWRYIAEYVLKDPQVRDVLRQRTAQALAGGWSVHPASDSAEDRRITKQTMKDLEAMETSLLKVLWSQLDAFFWGSSISEQVWGVAEDGHLRITAMRSKPISSWRYQVSDTGKLQSAVYVGTGVPTVQMQANRFLHLNFGFDLTNPYGDPPIDSIAFGCWLKRELAMKSWAVFLDRLGLPHMVFEHQKDSTYYGGNSDDKAQVEDFIENLAKRSGLLVPRGLAAKLLETARNGDAYRYAIDTTNAEITRAVMGSPLLANEGQRGQGSFALGAMQDSRAAVVHQMDGLLTQGELQRQVINRIHRVNHGVKRPAPQILLDRDPWESAAKMVTVASGLIQLANGGLEIPQSYVHRLAQIPRAEGGEPVLQATQAQGFAGLDNNLRAVKGEIPTRGAAHPAGDDVVRMLEQIIRAAQQWGDPSLHGVAVGGGVRLMNKPDLASKSGHPDGDSPHLRSHSRAVEDDEEEMRAQTPRERAEALRTQNRTMNRISRDGVRAGATVIRGWLDVALERSRTILDEGGRLEDASGFELQGDVGGLRAPVEQALARTTVLAAGMGTMGWLKRRPLDEGARRIGDSRVADTVKSDSHSKTQNLGDSHYFRAVDDRWAEEDGWTSGEVAGAALGVQGAASVAQGLLSWTMLEGDGAELVVRSLEAAADVVADAIYSQLDAGFRTILLRAYEEGWGFNTFRDYVQQNLGQPWESWKLERDFRTQMARMYTKAKDVAMEATGELAAWEWSAILDGRANAYDASLDGLVLPKDHPFWVTNRPPLHVNCRCVRIATFTFDLEDGTVVISPDSAIPEGDHAGF